MKPVSLRMEAFGPYGTVAEVDFGPLADVGLFVVAGPTGAGKSTIFDAICFGLYGSLSGARQGHVDVRSHYADPAADCVVEFVFDAQGQRWRVVRQPTQVRQKRRGRGTTERPAEATLETWRNGRWEPEAAKVRDVNARCRELVGLSLEQFERVVLLPQGKFAEVLNARTNERSELLRTLFGSEMFDRAAEVLVEDARDEERALAGADERRAAFHQRAADALDRADHELTTLPVDLELGPPSAEAPDTSPAGSQLSLLDDTSDAGIVEAAESALELTLVVRLQTLTSGPIASLEAAVDERREAADRMRSDLQRAEGQKRAIDQRTSARLRIAVLERDRVSMEKLAERIGVAGGLVGLSAAVGRRSEVLADLGRLDSSLAETWSRVPGLMAVALEDGRAPDSAAGALEVVSSAEIVGELLDRVAARSAVVDALVEAAARTGQKMADHDTLVQQVGELDAGAEGAATQRLALSSERGQLELERVDRATVARGHALLEVQVASAADRVATRRQFDDATGRVATSRQERQKLEDDADAARRAIAAASAEIARLDEIAVQLPGLEVLATEAERRVGRRVEIIAAVAEFDQATTSASGAQERADRVFADFLHDTAPRLAADLQDGSPCPVCGSCEHPAPGHADSTVADRPVVGLVAVEQAAAAAAVAQSVRSSSQAHVARLIGDAPELADTDLAVLESAHTEALGRLDAAGSATVSRDELVGSSAALESGLASIVESIDRADISLREAEIGLISLTERLGAAADLSIEGLQLEHRELTTQLEIAVTAERRVDAIADRQSAIDRILTDLEHVAAARSIERATITERLGQLSASIGRAEQRHADALQGADLDRVVEALDVLRTTLLGWQDRATALVARRASFAAVEREVAELVGSAGFEAEHDAVDASLPADELDRATTSHRTWADEVATLTATLAVLEGQDLPDDIPDLDQLRGRALTAEDHHRSLTSSLSLVTHAAKSASVDLDEVASIDTVHAERRARLDVLRRVANVVRGNNSKRLSLENWVLSVYLHDVVEHANVHLHTMSNGRYRLVVQDAPSNQVGQHGLGLVVDDAHTGRVRPSVSLSGGETFQASLALALGLADVVMMGRAGLHLDALFVDEGFGSLDADAIDQAITVLDGLRTRGSMVGVITHVEALKNALPVAIEVHPRADHQGSEIRQVA